MAEENINVLSDVEQQLVNTFATCPHCGHTLCYHQDMGEGVEAMTCLHCGFTTTNQMQEGSEVEQAVFKRNPRLYRDLRFKDEFGYVWYPAVVTVPEVGMVYIDGTSEENWEWVSTPVRKLTRKERRSGLYKEGSEYIAVPAKTKKFGKDGYIEALASLGLLGEMPEN